jgi:hypothetical protein
MNRLKILLSCVFCFGAIVITKAQDPVKLGEDKGSKRDTKAYTMQSLEGKSAAVHFMPNYFGHVLKISYLKDTVTINDFWGVPADVFILKRKFMEIDYAVRGGSGFGHDYLLMLCVSHGHLHKCMYVIKYEHSEGGGMQSDYNLHLLLTGTTIYNFKLNVTVADKRNNLSVLSFDVKNAVFYSVKKDFYEEFSLKNERGITRKEKLGDSYPELILGSEVYYYINNNWYTLDESNKLSDFALNN